MRMVGRKYWVVYKEDYKNGKQEVQSNLSL